MVLGDGHRAAMTWTGRRGGTWLDGRPGWTAAASDIAAYWAELVTTRANVTAWTNLAVPVRGLGKGKH